MGFATRSPTCPSTVGNIMHRVYGFNFGAGDNGNVMSIANCLNTTRTQNFTYDALNRIESAQSSGTQWGEAYTIDAWGNLYSRGGVSGKTYSEPLPYLSTNQNQLSPGFVYDPAGNMTSNQGTLLVYDDENRLIWTSQYRYLYDADGNRVEKCQATNATAACPTSGTTGTLYWRGTGSDTLDESDLAGNPEEEYIFFNGQRISRRDVSSTGATIAVHYYFSDQVGSHSVVENATGTACEQDIDYYPYGGVENDYCTTPVAQHYKFTGKERDAESGLDNFGARYNASSMGRFMTPDPLGGIKVNPQSLNKYAYVRNNPVNLTDPTGLYTCRDDNNQCKSKQDVAFEKARQQDLKSKDSDVLRAANAYGDPTKDNHVSVGFSADLDKKGEGGDTKSSLGADDKGVFAKSDVTISSKLSGSDLDAAVGHEGSHVADAQDFVSSISLTNTAPYFQVGTDITRYQSEQRAYGVSDSILRSENTSEHFACGLSDCILGTGLAMRGQLTDTVDRILANSPIYRSGGQPLSPTNQGGSVVKLQVPQ